MAQILGATRNFRVVFVDFLGTTTNKSILAVIRLFNCNTTWAEISHVGDSYHLLEVEILQNESHVSSVSNCQHRLSGLAELGFISFTFHNFSDNKSEVIEDRLPYRNLSMDSVGALSIQCPRDAARDSLGSYSLGAYSRTYCAGQQLTLNKSHLRELYPNLQSLFLAGVHSTDQREKLKFPWYIRSMTLPLNLSHSHFRQNLITDAYRQKVGSQQFVRTLGISGSTTDDIDNICPYRLQLNTLVLERNNIRYIPLNCFYPGHSQPSSLYYLDLTNNPLSRLRNGTFNGLTQLESLHLQNCELVELQPGLFDDLTNLKLLNLDSNKLEALHAGIFSKLSSLKNLFVHKNSLYHVEYHSLPIYSPNLSIVDFRSNRLLTFPYDCLTLPNLNLCDCDHNRISTSNLTDIVSHFNPIRMYFVQPRAFYGESYNIADIGTMHENDQSEISLRDNQIRSIDFDESWTR